MKRMKKSLSAVRCPTVGKFLFEHEANIFRPDIRLSAEHDVYFERDKNGRAYLEVLADKLDSIQMIRHDCSEFIRKLVGADGVDGDTDCTPTSRPVIASGCAGYASDFLCAVDIISERHGAELAVTVSFRDATDDLCDWLTVDAVRYIKWVPARTEIER